MEDGFRAGAGVPLAALFDVLATLKQAATEADFINIFGPGTTGPPGGFPGGRPTSSIPNDPNAFGKDGTRNTYLGGGLDWALPVEPKVGDTYGTGTAKMVWDGKKWVQGGIGFADYIPLDYKSNQAYVSSVTGAADVVKSGPVSTAGAAGAGTNISFDFSGANLTGTPEENEAMMVRVVHQVLYEQLGRDAYISGV